MSANFEKVKGYFDRGLWSAEQARNAVGRWITASEFLEITGMAYE